MMMMERSCFQESASPRQKWLEEIDCHLNRRKHQNTPSISISQAFPPEALPLDATLLQHPEVAKQQITMSAAELRVRDDYQN